MPQSENDVNSMMAERLRILAEIDRYFAGSQTWDDLFSCGSSDPGANEILEFLLRIFEALSGASVQLWKPSDSTANLVDRCRAFLRTDLEYKRSKKVAVLAARWTALLSESWPFADMEQMRRAMRDPV